MPSLITSLMAFTLAASLLTITPGLDTALVLRTAATERPRRAILTALGVVVGCLAWTVLVAAGLGGVLAASRLAYAALRWVGAAYLVWLGYKMLRYPRRAFLTPEAAPCRGSAFARGLLANLLNPKVGIFYVSFLPQFVPRGVPVGPYVLLLGAIHGVLGLAWFACLITATQPIARFLRTPATIPALDRVTGGLFVMSGGGLALEAQRP